MVFLLKAVASLGIASLLAQKMGPRGLGLYLLLLSVGNVAAMFCRLGVDQSCQKFVNEAEAMGTGGGRAVFWRLWGVVGLSSLGVFVVLVACWGLISRHVLDSEPLWGLLAAQLVMVLVLTAEKILSSFLRSYGSLMRCALVDAGIRQVVMAVVLAWLLLALGNEMSLTGVLLVFAGCGGLGLTVGGLWLWSVIRRSGGLSPGESPFPLKQMLETSVSLGISTGTAIIRGSADMFIIGIVLGPTAGGLYGPLKRLSTVISNFMPINKVLQPTVAYYNRIGDRKRLRAVCRKGTLLSLGMAVLLVAGVWACGAYVLGVFFGPEYSRLAPLLLVMMIGPFFKNAFVMSGVLLQMAGGHRPLLRINIAFCFVTIAAMAVGAQYWGLYGVGGGGSLGLALQFLTIFAVRKRILPLS